MKERWRNVSTKACVLTIIFSIVAIAVAVIPFAFPEGGSLTFTFSLLPLIGSGEIGLVAGAHICSILGLIPQIPAEILSIIPDIYNYTLLVYFGILLADILFAVLLIITKFKALRIIFKIFSVIFSIAFLLIALVNLVYIAGIFYSIFVGGFENIGDKLLLALRTTGITTALGLTIFSFMLVKKQLKWFSKPAWAKTGLTEKK